MYLTRGERKWRGEEGREGGETCLWGSARLLRRLLRGQLLLPRSHGPDERGDSLFKLESSIRVAGVKAINETNVHALVGQGDRSFVRSRQDVVWLVLVFGNSRGAASIRRSPVPLVGVEPEAPRTILGLLLDRNFVYASETVTSSRARGVPGPSPQLSGPVNWSLFPGPARPTATRTKGGRSVPTRLSITLLYEFFQSIGLGPTAPASCTESNVHARVVS